MEGEDLTLTTYQAVFALPASSSGYLSAESRVPLVAPGISPKSGLQPNSPAVHHSPEPSVENVQVEVVKDCVGKRYQVLLAVFC